MKTNKEILTKILSITVYALIATGMRYLFVIGKNSFFATVSNNLVYIILTGIGPLLGALSVMILFKRKIAYSGFGLSIKKSLLSVFIPICLFFFYDLITHNFSFSNTLIVITCLIYSFFEEFGWRGYLQSELIKLPTLKRISIITVIWFVWHLNFHVDQGNALFLLILFFGSWGIGQIAINTKSLLLCACFHAVINIINNIKMDLAAISLIIVAIISWFGIWYIKKDQ